MNKLSLFLIVISFSFSVYAQPICGRTQADIKTLLTDSSSRISFKNGGGFFNQGVCWWHNRLQRSSAYLVQYRPELPLPTKPEVWNILATLRNMNGSVVIPGYHDFESFTRDWKPQIQGMLNDWQRDDGFFNFEWIRGVSGRSRLDPVAMQARMKNIFDHYKASPAPLWIMAQIKGIESHSFLVLNMSARDNGYDLEVIDSNHPLELLKVEYYVGDVNLKAPKGKYTFVPYAGFQQDFRIISATLIRECGQSKDTASLGNVEDGEIELR